jgi:hypothetical protein
MKHKKAIEALQLTRESIIKRRNTAMALAALPYNEEIEQLDATIAHLRENEGGEEGTEQIKEIKQTHGGNRRGRKTVDYNKLDFEIYPLDESIIARFRYILKDSNRILSIAEVAEQVIQNEPNERVGIVKERFGKHIRKYEEKGFLRSVGKGRGKKYGLPEWWENNRLLNQYNVLGGRGGTDQLFPVHLLTK